jgi:hypothetical protein
MNNNTPKKTDEYGRNELGKFTAGNLGKPKGATNKNTRDLKDFITNFLNEKSFEIPLIWDSLDDKDKATLYLHLAKLVMPKITNEENENPKEMKTIIIELTKTGNE